jgi:ABC-type multidrug transport system fused ATPase/permease subunit
MVSLMLPPYFIARAIDDGLRPGDMTVLALWALGMLAVGVLNACLGLLRHRTMTFIRMDAGLRTIRVLARKSVGLGAVLPLRVSAGEVVSIGAGDAMMISQTLTITGPGVGAVIAYAAVTVVLLSISPLLAAVILVGVPVLVVVIGPLLGKLQVVQTEYRIQQGALTGRAGDIVAGLRVLCGIGGKEMFAERYKKASRELQTEGYRVGAVTSWIDALAVGLPGLFLAAVTWLAARMAAGGEITIGEMVAVYGYVAVLVTPVSFFIQGGGELSRGLVASRRVVDVLNLTPAVEENGDAVPGPAGPATLRDPASGMIVPPGGMLAVASARPADAQAIVDRLGRYVDSDAVWGTVPLVRIPLAEIRRRILVADNDAHLFSGELRAAVGTLDDHDDEAVEAAVYTAAADDIVAGLPEGLRSHIQAQGRNLSGGQRQRLRLVRALLAAPDVLFLVEPTSAVDAITEAVVVRRVHAARAGRTTVVVSNSPLLLDQADHVAYVEDGQVVATGTHAELLGAEAGYRALVFRGGWDDESQRADSRPSLNSEEVVG